MAYNYPPVNKIFDDLEKFRDFCRMGGWGDTWGFPFDEKDLYNNESPIWQAYQKHQNYLRAKSRNGGRDFVPRERRPNSRYNNNFQRG